MPRPLLFLATCLGVGCLVGESGGKREIAVLLGLGAVLLGLALAATRSRAAVVALGAAAVALGGAAAALERVGYEATPLRAFVAARPERAAPVLVEGRARGDGQELPDRLRLRVAVERVTTGGRSVEQAGIVRLDVFGDARRPEVLRRRSRACLGRPPPDRRS